MKLVFVHGWSVTDTYTYGELPEAIEARVPDSFELDIQHIYLGRYISFHDEVTVDDIARAFENARKEVVGENQLFSCITHSTGAPVIRTWIKRYYGADKLADLPLKHLIMLAPANFGSALAQLGKSRVSRIKSWFQGVEPGQGVLDWLELGSTGQRDLNLDWLNYKTVENGFYPVVLTGETIDKKLYDHLNSYTGEKGSDGVVRVAGANLNYRYARLKQNTDVSTFSVQNNGEPLDVYPLELDGSVTAPLQPCAMEVIPDASHTGKKIGIMLSVTKRNADKKPVVQSILDCLQVDSVDGYTKLTKAMVKRTKDAQKRHKYSMLVVQVSDDQGHVISDFDLYLLAGKDYDLNKLPKGFFMDRQKNKVNQSHLTYYFDHSVMSQIKDGKLGLRVVARPSEGFTYYSPGEFRSGKLKATDLLLENGTLLLDIELKRHVDVNTFRLDPATEERRSFKKEKPEGVDVG